MTGERGSAEESSLRLARSGQGGEAGSQGGEGARRLRRESRDFAQPGRQGLTQRRQDAKGRRKGGTTSQMTRPALRATSKGWVAQSRRAAEPRRRRGGRGDAEVCCHHRCPGAVTSCIEIEIETGNRYRYRYRDRNLDRASVTHSGCRPPPICVHRCPSADPSRRGPPGWNHGWTPMNTDRPLGNGGGPDGSGAWHPPTGAWWLRRRGGGGVRWRLREHESTKGGKHEKFGWRPPLSAPSSLAAKKGNSSYRFFRLNGNWSYLFLPRREGRKVRQLYAEQEKSLFSVILATLARYLH